MIDTSYDASGCRADVANRRRCRVTIACNGAGGRVGFDVNASRAGPLMRSASKSKITDAIAIRQWHYHEKTNQERLLQQFKGSFTTGNVTLLAEPLIAEDHTMLKASQNSSGISEYRIVAPINKGGKQLWAVCTNRIYRAKIVSGKIALTRNDDEPTHAREPAAGPESSGESSPPAQ